MGDPCREIIKKLMHLSSPTPGDLHRAKMYACVKYRLQKVPANSEIINLLTVEEKHRLIAILKRKTTRTISGVTVIAVMTKPYPCPQPEPCAYCPGGPSHDVPQSYTGYEPAAMRGFQNNYDPYLQVRTRIKQLRAIGHVVDKVELIIMGGTFPATPLDHQVTFIQRCLDAITERRSSSLEEAKKNAETSQVRNAGITVETRPDWGKETQVDQMLRMGVTRVEMGVQTLSNPIYEFVGRTHTVQDVVEATRIIKDAGLKTVYHLMPGLPLTNMEKDLQVFRTVFTNPDFKPDMIKIYPCLVLKDTKAYEWYIEGKYKPYTTEEAVGLITQIKKMTPPWVRIMRVQRDIPAPLIVAGVRKSNLRQLVQEKLREQGIECRCIRCREVGHRTENKPVDTNPDNVRILNKCYDASGGREIFISAEDPENNVLIGYLRLRVPSEKAHRQEIKATPCAIVRELHIYGSLVPVGEHRAGAWQHTGYGSILLAEAEHLSHEDYNLKKILVMSALGTKQYYVRFGYKYDGDYMSKQLGKKDG